MANRQLIPGGVDLSGEQTVHGAPVVDASPGREDADIVEASRNIAVMRETVSHPYNKDNCYVLITYIMTPILTWQWMKQASPSPTNCSSTTIPRASSTMLVMPSRLAVKYF